MTSGLSHTTSFLGRINAVTYQPSDPREAFYPQNKEDHVNWIRQDLRTYLYLLREREALVEKYSN